MIPHLSLWTSICWGIALAGDIALAMLSWRYILVPAIKRLIRQEAQAAGLNYSVACSAPEEQIVSAVKAAIRDGRLRGLHD